jgi:hypothetical protein
MDAVVARQPTLAMFAGGGTHVRAFTRRERACHPPAVVMYFAGNGAWRSIQPPCDCRENSPLRKASADFLALS